MATAVISSPRMRRRLGWAAGLVGAAAAVAAVVALLPSRSATVEEAPVSNRPAQVVKTPPTVPVPRAAINELLDRFVPAVIARRDLAAGWELVTPDARGSRAEWLRGVTPFQHYAAKIGRYRGWQVNYSYPNDVGFDIYLAPAKPTLVAYAFRAEAKKVGGRWRIAVFYPQASFQPAGKRQLVYTEQDMKPNLPTQPGSGRLSPLFLFVPVGSIVGLGVLGVLFASVRFTRRRARVREIERELAAYRST